MSDDGAAKMWGLLLIITLADYFKGSGFSSFTFYLLPLGIATWYTTRPLVALMVVLSTAFGLISQFHSGFVYNSPLVPYWNALLRLLTLSVFAYLALMYEAKQSGRSQTVFRFEAGEKAR